MVVPDAVRPGMASIDPSSQRARVSSASVEKAISPKRMISSTSKSSRTAACSRGRASFSASTGGPCMEPDSSRRAQKGSTRGRPSPVGVCSLAGILETSVGRVRGTESCPSPPDGQDQPPWSKTRGWGRHGRRVGVKFSRRGHEDCPGREQADLHHPTLQPAHLTAVWRHPSSTLAARPWQNVSSTTPRWGPS